MNPVTLFWLAPAFPFVTFSALAVAGSRLRRIAGWGSVFAVLCSVIVSALGLIATAHSAHSCVSILWFRTSANRFELSLTLDPLSALMALVVSVISGIVIWYAVSYMQNEERATRFFAEMCLFSASMLALVMSGDLITMFVAWELVGISSYVLIGFYSERLAAGAASTKAQFITRLTDLAMLMGVLLLANTLGNVTFAQLTSAADAGHVPVRVLTASAALIAIGALGKSAQVPFQGWLPDAMVGPTPVSALLHSATMVAAGVFVIARLYPVFAAAPHVLEAVAWIGVTTSVLGGLAALTEIDLKRLLAYSTMSQVGLMMTGLGAGSLLAGLLLLVVHAFYKSCLFLIAGAFDRAVQGTSLDQMRGVGRGMPVLLWAMLIASIALAGLPASLALPPKDAVLAAAWTSSPPLFWAALAAGLLTAAYSGRMFAIIAEGNFDMRQKAEKAVPKGFVAPIAILSILIPVTFLIDARIAGQPLERLFGLHAPEVLVPTVLSLCAASLGFVVPIWAQSRKVVWPFLKPLALLFRSEMLLIPAYGALRRVSLAVAAVSGWLDHHVFDRGIDSAARGAVKVVRFAGWLDRSVFDAHADAVAELFRRVISMLARFNEHALDWSIDSSAHRLIPWSDTVRRIQTGRIENYLLGIVLWAAILLVVVAGSF